MNAALRLIDRIREKNIHRWFDAYALHRARNLLALPPPRPRHLLFALCDHFEPLWGGASRQEGERRVRAWVEGYPAMAAPFRDADGRPPRHSFFFPGEQYAPSFLEGLADLVRGGYGEVELHLHHRHDTADNLRASIRRYLDQLAAHGHLSHDADGRARYGFIHGDWSLANAGEGGRWCGVDEEIPLLFETGCYADFTFPAAPDPCQPRIVNQIYWPIGDLSRRRAYERGERARVGRTRRDRLLLIQGPLALALATDRGGVRLRIENGNIAGGDPVTAGRVRTWVAQNIHVAGQRRWVFVKVHTHGAPESTASCLLSDGQALHRELCSRYNDGRTWVLHYVTAREMFNIAIAAMEGCSGDPGRYRDHVLPPPSIAARER
jgi:hypothetical protein